MSTGPIEEENILLIFFCMSTYVFMQASKHTQYCKKSAKYIFKNKSLGIGKLSTIRLRPTHALDNLFSLSQLS